MANCLVVASPSCLINEGRALSSRSCREAMLCSHSRGDEYDGECTRKDEAGWVRSKGASTGTDLRRRGRGKLSTPELEVYELTVSSLGHGRARSELARELGASSRWARHIRARLARACWGRFVARALLDDLPMRCWFAPWTSHHWTQVDGGDTWIVGPKVRRGQWADTLSDFGYNNTILYKLRIK